MNLEKELKGFGVGLLFSFVVWMIFSLGGWWYTKPSIAPKGMEEAERKFYEQRIANAKEHCDNLLAVKDKQIEIANEARKEAVAAKNAAESDRDLYAGKVVNLSTQFENYKLARDKTEEDLRTKLKKLMKE